MKSGKLNWDDLKNIIDNNKSVKREDVRLTGGIGEDCSVISYGNYDCVVSTDPITGALNNIGKLAVHINCNDIASSGVEPVGILVTILVPETSTLEEINSVMNQINEETRKLNVEIIGGHTEVTSAVNKVVVSCTVIGKCEAGKAVSTAGAKLGDDIIVTKSLAMEGTSIILNDYIHKVKHILTQEEIQQGKEYIDNISVVSEGKICGEFGVNSMHDITEGGVLGALWEMAKASGVGFEVYEEKMPISEITSKICGELKIDPLRLISSGSMLITSENGEKLVKVLNKNGIKACVIGKTIEKKGVIISLNNEKLEVEPPERDELFNIEGNISGGANI